MIRTVIKPAFLSSFLKFVWIVQENIKTCISFPIIPSVMNISDSCSKEFQHREFVDIRGVQITVDKV